MNFKHFIKTLLIFSVMIVVGLLGVFLLSRYDKSSTGSTANTGVAK